MTEKTTAEVIEASVDLWLIELTRQAMVEEILVDRFGWVVL